MSAPTWDQYMVPSLQVLSDGEVHRGREVIAAAADLLAVSDEQRSIVIPSGQEQWVNRGNWALSYLARARYVITQACHGLLGTYPNGLTEKDLRSVPGYVSPRSSRTALLGPEIAEPSLGDGEGTDLDPDDQVEAGVARIHGDVAD